MLAIYIILTTFELLKQYTLLSVLFMTISFIPPEIAVLFNWVNATPSLVDKYIKDSIKESEDLILSECTCSSVVCTHKKQVDTLWQDYHQQYKNINSPIDYAYCLSIHKSQGSTYDKVYLFLSDFVWFLSKGDIENFFKLFYVGVSRTKTTTILF